MDSISLVQVEVTNILLVWLEVTLSFAAGLNQRKLLKFSKNFSFLNYTQITQRSKQARP